MSVTYTAALKNARLDTVAAAIDAGAGPGYIEIGTASMAIVLATIPLTDPCAPAATGGILAFDFDPDVTVAATNTGFAEAARIRDSAGSDVVTGLSVGAEGTDVILDSALISAGHDVTIISAQIAHA